MANEEHLAILRQGVKAWNQWREENRDVQPDLSGAKLSTMDLGELNLSGANLFEADLGQTNLNLADLRGTHLRQADLHWANLSGADLSGADLSEANLVRADLSSAQFDELYFHFMEGDADSLIRTGYFSLAGADLSEVTLGYSVLADLDLSNARGLETVHHTGPLTIGIDTLQRSQGQIPEVFLRGCGLSDWEIESAKLYQLGLSNEAINDILYKIHDLRAHQAIQINPLFISYSHADSCFVDDMETHLNKKGIRFWRDIHHATSGRLERQIDRAMRLNSTVLLVLSNNSTQSDWVEHEARLARKLEKELGRDVLCPVALDDSWKTCRWPERLREQIEEYMILDFSKWEDKALFERMFTRLINGLDLFYKESA